MLGGVTFYHASFCRRLHRLRLASHITCKHGQSINIICVFFFSFSRFRYYSKSFSSLISSLHNEQFFAWRGLTALDVLRTLNTVNELFLWRDRRLDGLTAQQATRLLSSHESGLTYTQTTHTETGRQMISVKYQKFNAFRRALKRVYLFNKQTPRYFS